MINLSLVKNNYINITNAISHELNCAIDTHFKRRVKNCHFSPKYVAYRELKRIKEELKKTPNNIQLKLLHAEYCKKQVWDGYMHFYDTKRKFMYIGHLKELYTFLKKYDNDIQIIADDLTKPLFRKTITFHKLNNIVLNSEWQKPLVDNILQKKRCTIESPTGTGKTVVIASVTNSLINNNQRVLILFNRVELARQTKKRFVEYGINKEDVSVITFKSKNKNEDNAKIVLITVGSYKKLKHPEKFDALIVDESHHAQSESYAKIIKRCDGAWFRLGVSATYHDENSVDRNKIRGFLGPMIYVGDIEKHFESGELSVPKIYFIDYQDTEEQDAYAELELKHIIYNIKRNNAILKIANSFLKDGKRVCMLCHRQDHGIILGHALKTQYFYGNTPQKEIESGLKQFEDNKKQLFLGSIGVFGEGIDIKGGFDILMIVNSFASNMPVIQSIGRGLRKNKNMKVIIIDFIDSEHKIFLKHSKDRIKICQNKYGKEKVETITLKDFLLDR